LKDNPLGNEPVSESEGVGVPVDTTVKLLSTDSVKVAEPPLVIAGAESTVSVKGWLALGLTPLDAVMVIGYEPPAVGVPASVAVPSPLSVKVTPVGSTPDSDSEAVGRPCVVTVSSPELPATKVVDEALVMLGAVSTVSVKDWLALGLTPLDAVMENG
jgi:hypothetical protein